MYANEVKSHDKGGQNGKNDSFAYLRTIKPVVWKAELTNLTSD